MSKRYFITGEITVLQRDIMVFIHTWATKQKTPVPQKEIIIHMRVDGIKEATTVNALSGLLLKGYLRKAFERSNRRTYVLLRTV